MKWSVKACYDQVIRYVNHQDWQVWIRQLPLNLYRWWQTIDWQEVKDQVQRTLQDPIQLAYYQKQLLGGMVAIVGYWCCNLFVGISSDRSLMWIFFPHIKTLGWLILCGIGWWLWFKAVNLYYETVRKEKLKANGEKGEAEFANDRLEELKADPDLLYEEEELRLVEIKGERTAYRGIPLHVDKKKKYFYVDMEQNHNLIYGTTGAGKSQTSVLPAIDLLSRLPLETEKELIARGVTDSNLLNQAKYAQESMIINDVKGELFTNSYHLLKNRGYRIQVLNLKHPYHSDNWNPFEAIKRCYLEELAKVNGDKLKCDLDMVTNLVDAFVEMLIPIKDQYWDPNSQNLVSALMLAMLEDLVHLEEHDESVKLRQMYNPYTLVNLLNQLKSAKVSEDKSLLSYYFESRPVGNQANLKAGSIVGAPHKTQNTIISNTIIHLKLFMNDSLGRLMSENTIQIEDVIEHPTAIFIICPDNNKARWPLAAVFADQSYFMLTTYIEKTFPNDCSPRRINYLLDELAQMPAIPDLENKIPMARSRNIRYWFYLQSGTQLKNKYKDNSKIIEDCCRNWICLQTGDTEMVDTFLKRIGKTTVVQQSVSSQLGEMERNVSESLSEQAILHTNDVMKMKKEQGIVTRLGYNPIKSHFYSAWRYWTYQDEDGTVRVGVKKTYVTDIKERGAYADLNLSHLLTYVQTKRNHQNLFFFESCRVTGKIAFVGVKEALLEESSPQKPPKASLSISACEGQVNQDFPLEPPTTRSQLIVNDSDFIQRFREHSRYADSLIDKFDKIPRDQKMVAYQYAEDENWTDLEAFLASFKH